MDLVAKLKKKEDISWAELKLIFAVYEDTGTGGLVLLPDEEIILKFDPDEQYFVKEDGTEEGGITQIGIDAMVGRRLENIEKRLDPPTKGAGQSDLSNVNLTTGANARVIKQRKLTWRR